MVNWEGCASDNIMTLVQMFQRKSQKFEEEQSGYESGSKLIISLIHYTQIALAYFTHYITLSIYGQFAHCINL
jgi:hypothetical protein